jgi:ubiquinone/menaquinone biosynthesis C-methylase UbiE
MDIDEKLGPDVVGSVTDIPFEENSFELITCFEVLEHLPYSKSLKALGEMRRVSRDSVAISIPDWGHIFWVEIKMPFWGKCEWRIEFDRIVPLKDPRTEAEHFWELKKDLKEIGYKLGHTYKVKEMPSHRFIKLSIKT